MKADFFTRTVIISINLQSVTSSSYSKVCHNDGLKTVTFYNGILQKTDLTDVCVTGLKRQ